jgi:nucleoside-diphosphate-sugar epimerase
MTILVTGAAGFLGRHVVAAARARGHRVRALVRRASVPEGWRKDAMISVVLADLAVASPALDAALDGVDAVIHAAGALVGDKALQNRDTLLATETLVAALVRTRPAPRLVLVSSISVYSAMLIAEGSRVDENTPLENSPSPRDGYRLAKLAQEAMALDAALDAGFELCILRPGAVFGPRRLFNGHLGLALGPVLLRLGADGQVPLCAAPSCAEALVLAAELPVRPKGKVRIDVLNLVDNDLPDRRRYIVALRESGWPRVVLPLSWRIFAALAALAQAAGLGQRMPGLLRLSNLRARMMPLTYDNSLARRTLNWHPTTPFETAMRAALAAEKVQSDA